MQSWVVCYVGGEAARLFALMTDKMDVSFLQQFISHPNGNSLEKPCTILESDLGEALILGSTSELATERCEPRVLDDGRIGGIWALNGDTAFIILVQEDGNLVVDEVIDIIDE